MKKAYKFLPAALFLIFIVGMMVLFFVLPKKEYSSSEKRYLEQAPKFSFQSLLSGKFGEDFEKFLSDQTAGRNFWVPAIPPAILLISMIVRAISVDAQGNQSEIATNTYFIGYSQNDTAMTMRVISLVTDPENLFD